MKRVVDREISDALGRQAVMSEDDVIGYLEGLACKRPVFHSEADFQHALAWHIHEAIPDCRVRLEFKPCRITEKGRKKRELYLDIWLPDAGVAMELKYKTRKVKLPHDNEVFSLRDQAAQDCGRYDFIQDLRRLEWVVNDGKAAAKVGFAVFLTNDPFYWECPRFLKYPRYRKPNDYAFRIHEGRELCGKFDWCRPAADTDSRKDPISLRGKYPLTWRDYSSSEKCAGGSFRFLLVQVRPRCGY